MACKIFSLFSNVYGSLECKYYLLMVKTYKPSLAVAWGRDDEDRATGTTSIINIVCPQYMMQLQQWNVKVKTWHGLDFDNSRLVPDSGTQLSFSVDIIRVVAGHTQTHAVHQETKISLATTGILCKSPKQPHTVVLHKKLCMPWYSIAYQHPCTTCSPHNMPYKDNHKKLLCGTHAIVPYASIDMCATNTLVFQW